MASEAQHQCAVIKWSQQVSVRSKWPFLKLLFHVPNGGKRNEIEAKHMKEQGVKRGVPDLCLPVARGKYHGLYIEMKTETGTTSPDQDWWIQELLKQGYFVEVCRGYQSAVSVLELYCEMRDFQYE